ncbi:protein of unknown function [Candidatus Promineifilum breve]|uniref:Uncharacterized protein n=1 Tax=Candidatus Promineifilum breve TaxID=1806508 RepID=A0A160T5G7_9CHLR|nr:protein of unknown function [Candidatus Promineifilum breve]
MARRSLETELGEQEFAKLGN